MNQIDDKRKHLKSSLDKVNKIISNTSSVKQTKRLKKKFGFDKLYSSVCSQIESNKTGLPRE